MSDQQRTETASERADRNFSEVVQELRVAQTGVQVLFAFLLSLSFLGDFPSDDRLVSGVYTTALLCSAGAAVVFIAPVAFHRLHFRQGLKEQVVWLTHVMSLIGLVLLIAAMVTSVWIVMSVLWGGGVALGLALGLLVAVVLFWVVIPRRVLRRAAERRTRG